jgi:hypothetical protein
MLKKILLAFIASIILFTSTVTPALAASTGTWYNQTFPEWFTKVNTSPSDEIFGERYTSAQVQWVVYGFFNFIVSLATGGNNEVVACVLNKTLTEDCLRSIKNIKILGYQDSNAGTFLSVLGNSPVSFTAYAKDVAKNFILIPKAEAQEAGFGFTSLNPALNLWKAFRNISYGLMVFVVVIFAFMIMFRVKISPQAVITVQSSIPKIAITLIIITFSYAIAGLLIDLMYVVMGILSSIIAANFSDFSWTVIFQSLAGNSIDYFGLFSSYWLMFVVGSLVSIFTSGHIVSLLLTVLAILSIIVMLWYIIKIFFILIKNYVEILLLVIFSPVILLVGALSPQGGIGGWIKSLVSKLAIYPVIAALLFIRMGLPQGDLFTSLSPLNLKDFTTAGETWAPPFTSLGTGMGGTNLLWLAVSWGIIVMIPKVVEIVQGFMSGKGYDYGTAIGESVGFVKSLGGSAPVQQVKNTTYNEGYKRFITDTRLGQKIDSSKNKYIKGFSDSIKQGLEKRATG